MMRMLRIVAIQALFVCISFSCSTVKEKEKATHLTVSIAPLKYIVQRVAGDGYEVRAVVPEGAEAESFDPSPRDLAYVSNASLLFQTGYLEFEHTLIDKAMNDPSKIVDLSKDVRLVREAETLHQPVHSKGIDPHFWLSVREVKNQAKAVCRSLVLLNPGDSVIFTNNLEKFLSSLDSLEAYASLQLSQRKRASFIIYHPALAYLARDYNLNQLSIENEGKEPSAAHMKSLVDQAKKEGIRTIFLQKQYDLHLAESLAREINGKVVSIDPLSGDWMNNMKNILQKLGQSLNE